jgi:hypothetical protein
MTIFTHTPWRPDGVRVYTDEERLEGEKLKDWTRSVTKNEHSPYTCADPDAVADNAEIARMFSDLELEGQYQSFEDYLDPAMIATGFLKFDIYAVTEIWNLEKQVREAATEALEPNLRIKLEDKNLSGLGHSIWASMDEASIEAMDESEKRYALDLAKEDILFLRTRAIQLQRLVHDRKEALKRGETLEKFSYPGKPRPVEQEAFFIDGLEEAAYKPFKDKLKELTRKELIRVLLNCESTGTIFEGGMTMG